jgi:FkbM family methyltransferase
MEDTLIGLVKRIGLTALDVGARGGGNSDLLEIAGAVDFVGFEPDAQECARLNGGAAGPWRSARFLPVALGAQRGEFDLNLYSKRGCSSKLVARMEVGERFSRGDFLHLEQVVRVPCAPLDEVLREAEITAPASMKIDVQGMEIEVFDGALTTLRDHLCAVRTEVAFFPLYEQQPLFAEVDQRLRRDGLVPMRWLESHEWRRFSKRKLPSMQPGPMPFSRGQLMHADVLYLQQPEALDCNTEAQMQRLLRLAVLAACHEHYDHALAALQRGQTEQYAREGLNVDVRLALQNLSKARAGLGRRLGLRLLRWLQNRLG